MKKSSWLACGLSLTWGTGIAAAAADTIKLEPTAVEFPRRIGPMYLQGEPHKYDPPSLGVSYQFSGSGLSLTVYVYDVGLEDIPDGGDTVVTCKQFEQAKQDVLAAGYGNTVFVSQQLARLAPPADLPLAREAKFEFRRDGRATVSYLWLTAVSGHFVKLRFSVNEQLRDELPEARRAVLTALGTALGPHLQPVAADTQKPGTTMSITSGAVDDMATGFMYLLLLSGVADKADHGPVCGGEYVPSFEEEVGLYRALFEIDPEDGPSPLLTRLMQADKAGYLEELIWTEAHRAEWGESPPAGLTLGDYKPWKKKNLKRFRMQSFGAVAVGQPRPLPLEAADTP
jgi:hypothetical protein